MHWKLAKSSSSIIFFASFAKGLILSQLSLQAAQGYFTNLFVESEGFTPGTLGAYLFCSVIIHFNAFHRWKCFFLRV